MGNNSESKQAITNYIKGWRNHYSRFSIDAHLLEQGCDPSQVDAAWRELNRPRPWWQRLHLSTETEFTLFCLLWLVFIIVFPSFWPSFEGYFTRQPFPLIVITSITCYCLIMGIRRSDKSPSIRHTMEWLAFLVAFFLCSAMFVGVLLKDWTWGDDPPDRLYSQLNTSEAHYLLVSNVVPTKIHSTGMGHLLQLYRCNTFGFDCHVITEQETGESIIDDSYRLELFCLKLDPNGHVLIAPTKVFATLYTPASQTDCK